MEEMAWVFFIALSGETLRKTFRLLAIYVAVLLRYVFVTLR